MFKCVASVQWRAVKHVFNWEHEKPCRNRAEGAQ
jgi:hypothetical protein